MNKHTLTGSSLSIVLSATLLAASFAAFPASAATAAATARATAKAAKLSAQLPMIITRSDKAIDARVADLTKLGARVADMKNVSDAERANVATEVQTQISGLTALKTKIDADTDVTVARADEKTIAADFRIYALIVPQGLILASADRVAVVVAAMNTVGTKLQARIAAAKTAGKDVASLETALADMSAKMNDAGTQAQAAYAKVSALVPDKGDKAIAASNKASLQAARKDIKAATADLQAARKDVKTIVEGLKKVAPEAAVSVTASSTVSQ